MNVQDLLLAASDDIDIAKGYMIQINNNGSDKVKLCAFYVQRGIERILRGCLENLHVEHRNAKYIKELLILFPTEQILLTDDLINELDRRSTRLWIWKYKLMCCNFYQVGVKSVKLEYDFAVKLYKHVIDLFIKMNCFDK